MRSKKNSHVLGPLFRLAIFGLRQVDTWTTSCSGGASSSGECADVYLQERQVRVNLAGTVEIHDSLSGKYRGLSLLSTQMSVIELSSRRMLPGMRPPGFSAGPPPYLPRVIFWQRASGVERRLPALTPLKNHYASKLDHPHLHCQRAV